MIKLFVVLFALVAVTVSAGSLFAEHKPGQAEGHQKSAGMTVSSHEDVKKYQACPHCGMDREKFAHSRMLIVYSDGSSAGVCSLHCAATELKASKGKVVRSVEVADLNSKRLVDADKATWVIGGNKKGVMTRVAKWAFAKKTDAETFIKANGGKLASYKESLAQAEKE